MIVNLKPEMSMLRQVDDLNYEIDYGLIPKGSDPNLKLRVDIDSKKLSAKASCGGCTKVSIDKNILSINYNTNLLGRITKKVYLYTDENTIILSLKGKVLNG